MHAVWGTSYGLHECMSSLMEIQLEGFNGWMFVGTVSDCIIMNYCLLINPVISASSLTSCAAGNYAAEISAPHTKSSLCVACRAERYDALAPQRLGSLTVAFHQWMLAIFIPTHENRNKKGGRTVDLPLRRSDHGPISGMNMVLTRSG